VSGEAAELLAVWTESTDPVPVLLALSTSVNIFTPLPVAAPKVYPLGNPLISGAAFDSTVERLALVPYTYAEVSIFVKHDPCWLQIVAFHMLPPPKTVRSPSVTPENEPVELSVPL
jgi:hypothetical protein